MHELHGPANTIAELLQWQKPISESVFETGNLIVPLEIAQAALTKLITLLKDADDSLLKSFVAVERATVLDKLKARLEER